MGYAGTDKSVPQIGEELGVGHILEGTVDWADAGAGSRVRISVELIRVADAELVWSNSFDRVIENVFDLQSDIARQVIDQLGVTLLGSEPPELAASATENTEAYKLYIKGRFFWDKRTDQDVQTGLAYFQQAVALDPGYSLAHVGIALVWIYRGWYSIVAPSEAATHVKEAVVNALQFDEALAEAHAALAEIYFEFDHDWEAAEGEYELAIGLDPNYATGHQWYSGYLSAMGRPQEALREAARARELDPLSPIINTFVGLAALLRRPLRAGHSGIQDGTRVGPSLRAGALASRMGAGANGAVCGSHLSRAAGDRQFGGQPSLHRVAGSRLGQSGRHNAGEASA